MTTEATQLRENPDQITLLKGNHRRPEDGMCLVEAAAYVAGEPFSDHPECVSPVIGAFCRNWNDSLGDVDRNRLLKPYITKIAVGQVAK